MNNKQHVKLEKFIKTHILIVRLEKELESCKHKYTGNDSEMIKYLNNLYQSSDNFDSLKVEFKEDKCTSTQLSQFNSMLSQNIDMICFSANQGEYGKNLEKSLSLSKKSLKLNNKEQVMLYRCNTDLNNYGQIRPNLYNQICRTQIFPKYKKNDTDNPDNFRYLFNHHKILKILDKLWSIQLIEDLIKANKLLDNNIYKCNINMKYSCSIKEHAYAISQKNENKLLLDISRAYDSVSWKLIKTKLKLSLIDKLGNKGLKYYQKYTSLISNRKCYYQDNLININKGVPTGLPSSILVFTLIFETIISEFMNRLTQLNIKHKIDYLISVYVDDICIEIINYRYKNIISSLILKIISRYGYKINIQKCYASSNLELKQFNILSSQHFYLGLPFSNKPKEYLDACLNDFSSRYIKMNYNQIKIILQNSSYQESHIYKKLRGFFQYKLYGLKKYNLSHIIHSSDNICKVKDLPSLIDYYYPVQTNFNIFKIIYQAVIYLGYMLGLNILKIKN